VHWTNTSWISTTAVHWQDLTRGLLCHKSPLCGAWSALSSEVPTYEQGWSSFQVLQMYTVSSRHSQNLLGHSSCFIATCKQMWREKWLHFAYSCFLAETCGKNMLLFIRTEFTSGHLLCLKCIFTECLGMVLVFIKTEGFSIFKAKVIS
jgi:hypothetical protein